MGLEIVELIMDVEEEFDLQIHDGEAQTIYTLGQLHQLVLRKLGRVGDVACRGMSAFHRVRQALVGAGVALRAEVRSDFDLARQFESMPEAWAFFLRALNLRPMRPPLPARTHRLLRWTSGLAVVALLILVSGILFGGNRSPALVLPAAGSLVTVVLLTLHVEQRLPVQCGTVRGFIKYYDPALSDVRDDAVWERLIGIVAKSVGVEPAALRPESRLPDDLLDWFGRIRPSPGAAG